MHVYTRTYKNLVSSHRAVRGTRAGGLIMVDERFEDKALFRRASWVGPDALVAKGLINEV